MLAPALTPLIVIVPSAAPLQLTLVDVADTVTAIGSVIVTVADVVHPLLSVMSTTCSPGIKPVAVAVVGRYLRHHTVRKMPPVAVTFADPLSAPKHVIAVSCTALAARTTGSSIVTVADVVQPLLSVISTTCRPGVKPIAVAAV